MLPFGKVKKKTIPWRERSATQSFRTITMLTALIISEIYSLFQIANLRYFFKISKYVTT